MQGETNAGQEQAQEEIWNRYYEQLTKYARLKRRRLPEAVENEEDAALSAFHSCFERAGDGQFPELENRDDLWRVLATITARKVCRQIERLKAKKRGGGKVVGEAVLEGQGSGEALRFDELGAETAWPPRTNPTEALNLEFRETLEALLKGLSDDTSKRVAERTENALVLAHASGYYEECNFKMCASRPWALL